MDIAPVVEFLIAHRVEGIIFAVPQLGTNVATVRAQLPSAVAAGRLPQGRDVADRSRRSASTTTGAHAWRPQHLLALGRTHIGHLAGPLIWREAQDRHDGWLDALREAGVEPGPMVAGNWTPASGEAGFDELLALDPALDGLFVANDQMALGILHAAHARGVAVPDRLAVVGFDGLDEGAHFTPSLTTIVQPLRELGELAVREVLAMTEQDPGHASVRSLTLATGLMVRASAPAAVNGGVTGRDRTASERRAPAAPVVRRGPRRLAAPQRSVRSRA